MMFHPVISKEFRSRMRGWKAPVIITLYLFFLAAIGWAFFYLENRFGSMRPETGLQAFTVLSVVQLGLIGFTTPALTAGTISSEREHQTLDLLLCTKLSTLSIVTGKMVAALGHIVLLVVSSIPLFSIVFFFGGVSLKEFILLFFIYLITAVFMGSIGVFFSTVIKKTPIAIVLTYIVLFLVFVGTIMLAFFLEAIKEAHVPFYEYKPPLFLYINPLAGITSAIPYDLGIPFVRQSLSKGLEPWEYFAILDLSLSMVLLLLSSYIINPVKKLKFRIKKMNF